MRQRVEPQVAETPARSGATSRASKLVVTDRTKGLERPTGSCAISLPRSLTGLPNRLLLDDRIAQAIIHGAAALA